MAQAHWTRSFSPTRAANVATAAYPVGRDLLLPLNRANHPDVAKRVDYPALYDGHILSER